MRKIIAVAVLALAVISCNKTTEAAAVKTAYVDTSKLLEEYTAAKDVEAKYKAKSQELGKGLQDKVARFQAEAQSFRSNAQANGQAWAQQKGAELAKREQELRYEQDALLQQLQMESGKEMDTLVKTAKQFIKDYGKEKGYDYIYGTGEAVSILYAKDQYDITKEVIKLLNDKYASEGKKETAAPATK
jgi:outer membrane protein